MNGSTTCIRDAAWVVAWNSAEKRHEYLNGGDVAFTGDKVVHVGGRFPGKPDVEIDGRSMLVMPGLVNIHTHLFSEPMIKGLTDEVGSRKLYMSSLYEYLYLFEPDTEGAKAATEVALCELLMSGVTSVADLSVEYDGWADLLGASGIRAWLTPMYRSARWVTTNGHEVKYEWNEAAGRAAMDRALGLVDRARQHPSGRLDGMLCPSQIDTCTADLISDSAAAARERGIPFQIHAAQSVVEFQEITRRHGRTPVEWLDDLGVLGESSIIGHGIFLDHHDWLHWPTRTDLGRIAKSGTTVAHCPTVFARRAISLQHLGAYREAGVRMGMGTDTFPHNMFEEMRNAAYLARVTAGNVHSVMADDLFTAATIGGATALGRDDIGRLSPGMKADLVLVDVTHPSMRPMYDPIRSLIYAAAERPIRDVYVDGRQVVRGGTPLAFDYADASARLDAAQKRSFKKVPQFDWGGRGVQEIIPLTFPVRSS